MGGSIVAHRSSRLSPWSLFPPGRAAIHDPTRLAAEAQVSFDLQKIILRGGILREHD